jgi:hypothetical protein
VWHGFPDGTAGTQKPPSFAVTGTHCPFWQVAVVGDRHPFVVAGGVHEAPSLIGVWTQIEFWLHDPAEQLDAAGQPLPAPSGAVTVQLPRLQNPLKQPAEHVTFGGFG